MSLDEYIAEAQAAHEAGFRGDFQNHRALIQRLGAVSADAASAWAWALVTQIDLASPTDNWAVEPVALATFAAAEDPVTKAGASIACAHLTRGRMLALDREGFDAWLNAHQRFHEPGELSDQGALWLAIHRSWQSLWNGNPDGAELANPVGSAARTQKNAHLVLEAAILKASGALATGQLDEAVQLARRASRMGRTESCPQQEYLANVVLARLRRLSGKPHLATLILAALIRVAGPRWWPWLQWELFLASGQLEHPSPAPAPQALAGYVAAARKGDRKTAEATHRQAVALVRGIAPLENDTNTLAQLIDHRVDSSRAPIETVAWLSGGADDVPGGLASIGTLQPSSGDPPSPDATPASTEVEAAVVWAPEGETARRVLTPGVGLLPTGASYLPATKGRQARTDSTMAALLLAGPDGLDEDALFRRIYGFAFDEALHRGVRDVLYTRVRQRLEERGALERSSGRVRIRHDASLVVPDPRCSPPRDHVLLWLLARHGHTSAKDAAKLLGIPVRTAQDGLRRLVDDGVCRAQKVGRRLEYHLEDTTFREPTQV